MKGQILLIDDNTMDIKIISSVLERSGYACYGYTNYKQALEWLQYNTPQFIFLDLQMPEITGYELIPILRKLNHILTTPIIIVSGKNQIEDVMKAIKLGANDYIVKPIDPLVLQEKIRQTKAVSSEEFHSVDVGSEEGVKAFFAKPLQIISVSEFGVRILSETQIPPGETIEIAGISNEFFGSERLLLRCLNCERDQSSQLYSMQMTYTGMSETQRQIIRKSCRQIWIQSKKATA